MLSKCVQYVVKPHSIEETKVAIAQFLNHIKKGEPGTIYYDCYQDKNKPANFFHVMAFKNIAAEETHKESSYCKNFIEKLQPITIEGPDFKDLEPLH